MKKTFYLLVLLLNAATIFAQGEFVIELDPTTAAFTKIGGPIPGIHWIYPEVRTYDEVNGRMIFPGGDPIPDHLYSIDISNGNVVSSPVYPSTGPSTFNEPQFDNTTGTLFGLYRDTTSSLYLATMDPATGIHAIVGTTPIPGLNGLNQGMDTYDELHHKYLVVSSNTLFSIDAQTGLAVSVPLAVQPGDALINLSFSKYNDTLYGLMREDTSQLFFLVAIDPDSGSIAKIGNGTVLAAGNGSATIDSANRRFIYSYYDQGLYYLSVMGLDSGNVIFNNQVALDNVDNIHSLEYDNTRQKLFAIHWDDLIQSTGLNEIRSNAVLIYPDPASAELHVRLAKNYQNLHVALFNVTGQQVRSYEYRQAQECTFLLHDISPGVYFLKFDAPGESFFTKFIKE